MTSMVAAIAPVHLLGSLAPEIQDDLGFGDAAQGLAVAGFFGLSAVLTSWGGAFTDRRGSTLALRVAVVASLLGAIVLMVAPRFWVIVVGLLIAAVGNAIAQPGNNAFVSAGVPAERRGLAVGLKQSAIPISTGLAGLALPVIAITLGWRAAYLHPIAIAVGALVLIPVMPRTPVSPTARRVFRPGRGLAQVTLGSVAAGVAVAPVGAFLVRSLEDAGFDPGTAGIVQLCGSVLLITTRISWGRLMDRTSLDRFRFAFILLAIGSTGYPLLAYGNDPLMVVGALIAYGAAWSWPGVAHLGVVEHHPDDIGGASGILQAGMFTGATLGPGMFGIVAEQASFATAWTICFGGAVLGAIFIGLGGRTLRHATEANPAN